MKLSKDQVRKVANLANLPISTEEEEKYSQQLSKILDYIDQLNQIDTQKVEPTFNVSPNKNVTREDFPGKSLTQEDALSNAPKKSQGYFLTKGIFENE